MPDLHSDVIGRIARLPLNPERPRSDNRHGTAGCPGPGSGLHSRDPAREGYGLRFGYSPILRKTAGRSPPRRAKA